MKEYILTGKELCEIWTDDTVFVPFSPPKKILFTVLLPKNSTMRIRRIENA